MSIEKIQTLLRNMNQRGAFKLYGITHVQNRKEDYYQSCDLLLEPNTLLSEFFRRVCEGRMKKQIDAAEGTTEYMGEFSASYIEKFSVDNDESLIYKQVEKLKDAIGHSADTHRAPELSSQMKAFVLVGICPDENGEDEAAYFGTVRAPFLNMRHRFFYSDGAYRESTGSCLALAEHFDFIISRGICYAFTDKAESFFSLERSFRKKCDESVKYILDKNIVSDSERFQSYATKGLGPRKFLGFRSDLVDRLSKEAEFRGEICARFGIKLTAEGGIDTSDDGTSDRLIRLICGRGAQDVLDQSACAVPSVHPWH